MQGRIIIAALLCFGVPGDISLANAIESPSWVRQLWDGFGGVIRGAAGATIFQVPAEDAQCNINVIDSSGCSGVAGIICRRNGYSSGRPFDEMSYEDCGNNPLDYLSQNRDCRVKRKLLRVVCW